MAMLIRLKNGLSNLKGDDWIGNSPKQPLSVLSDTGFLCSYSPEQIGEVSNEWN